jgi:GT2 family glycosyltransferase
MKNLVYCVVPNWNGKKLIGPCIDSLLKQTLVPRIIVVDNGSQDGSVSYIKTAYPGVEVIELAKNYGFAGGVNRGTEYALKKGADFVALINNDATAEPDWLTGLLKTAQENPKTGIVTSKILRADKKHIDSTGDFYTIWGLPFPRGRNEEDHGQYDKQLEVFAASGGASLYRASVLKKIGLFDEDFFAYFEDVDISFRAQLAGWNVKYEPSAVVYHKVNATSSKLGNFARYHSVKNFMFLYAKNMPTKLYFKYLPFFIVTWLRWLASSTVRGHFLTFAKAAMAAILLHFKTLKKRRQIQGLRKVSVKYIDSMLVHSRPPKPPKLEKT